MKEIKVIDEICGGGKTTWMMHEIARHPNQAFIYITPYNDEVDRVLKYLKSHNVKCTRVFAKRGSKTSHVRELLMKGENIVITHSLLDYISLTDLSFIKPYNYTLYMDEVHQTVKELPIAIADVRILLKSGTIEVREDNLIVWLDENYNSEKKGKVFTAFQNLCEFGQVFLYGEKIVFYTFPIKIFEHMREVYVATYMFEGQLQYAYYNTFNIPIIKYGVGNKNGDYVLVPYDKEKAVLKAEKFLEKIHISDSGLQLDNKYWLSSTWFSKQENQKYKPAIKNSILAMRKRLGAKSEDIIWTTLKTEKANLRGKGYTKGFVSLGTRATNEYIDKWCLMYIYNVFINPNIKNFLISRKGELDEEKYALSELLQWIFRSRLRRGEDIELYIPSSRMRNLLENWEEYL